MWRSGHGLNGREHGRRASTSRRSGGPPAGETKQAVWDVLSLFLEGTNPTDELITTAHEGGDDLAASCEAADVPAGLTLRVLVTDLPGLRRILAWKPAK